MPDKDPPQRPGILKQDSYEPSAECASPSSYLGLNYAQSPRGTPKCKSNLLIFLERHHVISMSACMNVVPRL